MTDAARAAFARDLIRDEGTGPIIGGRLMPYEDSRGFLTLGIGRNIESRGISMEEAHFLLLADIADTLAEIARAWPWALQMDDARQRVLANMAFNMGVPTLSTFRRTLAAMQAGDYVAAAAGMRASKWAEQVKDRADRLARQMETGNG